MAGLLGAAPVVSAQGPAQAAPAQGQGTAAAAPEPDAGSDAQTGYTYDAEGRRDPFISLVRRGNESAKNESGVRPAGLEGIAVGELTLKGTMQSRDGYVGLVQGP